MAIHGHILVNSAKLTEEEKRQDKYLKSEIDYAISSCVKGPKSELQRAYNLRNGVRDADKFNYLWAAYGIEFPSQMRHIPVLRSMFDVLVGQERVQPLNYVISSVDRDSIEKSEQERHTAILDDVNGKLQESMVRNFQKLQQEISNEFQNPGQQLSGNRRTFANRLIEKIEEDYERNWKSSIEIAGQHMMEYQIQRMKLKMNFSTMFEDLITGGHEYYQVKVIEKGKDPLFRVINPINLYYSKNANTKFIKDCERCVYVEQLTANDIIQQYGHKMKKKDLDRFIKDFYKLSADDGFEVINGRLTEVRNSKQIDSNNNQIGLNQSFINVYHVEWKANNKIEYDDEEFAEVEGNLAELVLKRKKKFKYRLDRYEGVRIGEDIYVDKGKSKHIVRSMDNPSNCDLTFNGTTFSDRNGEPYSLVLKTEDIQDKIDILHYHWENLVAMSGTKAIPVNFPDIPVWMGTDPVERAMKWLGFVKQGLALVDYSQRGEGVGKFNNYGDFDLTLSQSITILWEGIRQLEETASKITGVSRQRLGSVSQSDGKGTTEIAVTQSTLTTQDLFSTHSDVIKQCLTDILNASRYVHQEGMKGSYILGEKRQKLFTINPDELLADFNIFVSDSGEELRRIDDFKGIASELVAKDAMDLSDLLDVYTTRSLTQVKDRIDKAKRSSQQQRVAELEEQLEQASDQVQKLTNQVEALMKNDANLKQAELQLKSQTEQEKLALERDKLLQDNNHKSRELDNDNKRIELEALQLADGNPYNREIKNN